MLSEVMTLRQEKTQLKGRLKDAQQEIDSLEATLKEHEHHEVDVLEFREDLTAHLEGFHEQVCVWVCVCVCVLPRAGVGVCWGVPWSEIHVHTWMNVRSHTYLHIRRCLCVCVCVCVRVCVHSSTLQPSPPPHTLYRSCPSLTTSNSPRTRSPC